MSPFRAERFALPTAVALSVVLLASLLTASFRLGARSGGLTALPVEFDVLADIYGAIEDEALRVPGDGRLAEGAARGLLAALGDPHAAYFDEGALDHFNETLDGTFSGVGLVMERAASGSLMVIFVLEGGPAAQAGVVVGERIVSVDGKPIAGLADEEVKRRIRGPEGTRVRVGFDGGPEGPRDLRLVRRKLELPVLDFRMLDATTGYIELLSFPVDIGDRVRAAVRDLIEQGAQGLVFDLRGNPGGLLQEAVTVGSVFVDRGTIVSVKERSGPTETFTAVGDAFAQIPLVVLIDQGTASAAEIVAAAIGESGRGRLVGMTTFGKGTVQVVRSLPNGGGLKFTTAEYLTSSGASIEGKGVAPHVAADGDRATQLAAARRELANLVARGGS